MIDKDKLPSVRRLHGEKAVLLLGTDAHVCEGTPEQERRIGLIPAQVQLLSEWLDEVGISFTALVIRGAGKGAGYSDEDYSRLGVRVVDESELKRLEIRPDVVHALKEPSTYESTIPGPFLRIGALHSGNLDPESGLSHLLLNRNFCAIFDGSSVGGYSYKLTRGYEIPIRSSMSKFAGIIAADTVGEKLDSVEGRVVICGGGVVGLSAAKRLLSEHNNRVSGILIIEEDEKRIGKMKEELGRDNRIQVEHAASVIPEDLRDASGLILAIFRRGARTQKVVQVQSLAKMRRGGVIVDVSIDEGGSIESSIEVSKAIAALGMGFTYVAETNMPRKYPREASEAHGDAVLPYIAVLLYICALVGNPIDATKLILEGDMSQIASDYLAALVCDLRNGLAYTGPNPIYMTDVVAQRATVSAYLDSKKIIHGDLRVVPC